MPPSPPELEDPGRGDDAGFRAFAAPRLAADRLRLRPAQAADLPLLASIYATTREEELRLLPWTDAQRRTFTDWQSQMQESHYALHYPAAERLVIEQGEAIGRIYVDTTPVEIRVMEMTLLPAMRGRGIGTRLMASAVDYADRLRRPLSLHVEPYNPARRLYLRLGFRAVETRGLYEYMLRPVPAPVS